MRVPALVIGTFVLAIGRLCAQDIAGQIHKLSEDLQQDLDARHQVATSRRSTTGAADANAANAVAEFRNALSNGNEAAIEAALNQMSISFDSPAIRQECADLAATLRREREAQDKKTLEDIDAVLERAAAAVRTAKTPAELDPILAQFAKFRAGPGGQPFNDPSAEAVIGALNKVKQARQFVTEWQDYLAEIASDDTASALQTLRSLAASETFLLPRSEILTRIDATAKATEAPPPHPAEPPLAGIVSRIKTLDALGPAMDALAKISRDRSDRRHDQAEATIEFLAPLDQSYRDFCAGQATNVELVEQPRLPGGLHAFTGLSPDGSDDVSRAIREVTLALRSQLVVLSLPRYLDLPPGTQARPGEGPLDFLARIKAEKLAAGDYVGAAKADNTRAFLRTGDISVAESSQAGLFLAADRQTTAGQYALATASYERALASESDLIPAKVIGERLDAIKAQHPQEFAQGFDLYLSPPAERYPAGMGYRAGMAPFSQPARPGLGRPGAPDYGAPEPPSLAVPAAAPSPFARPGAASNVTPGNPPK